MAGRKLQGSSLWIYYLLSIWVIGIEAGLVDVASCSDFKQHSYTDDSVTSYGNALRDIETALSETAEMVVEANNAILAVKEKKATWFERTRTVLPFLTLQVDDPANQQARWDAVFKRTRILRGLLEARDSQRTKIYCGDAHLVKYLILSDGSTVKSLPEDDDSEETVVGFKYYDPIIAQDPEADVWWPENVRACDPANREMAATVNFHYILVCHSALEQSGLTIGDNHLIDWGDSQYGKPSSMWRKQYLSYWAGHTSFTLLHELIHLFFLCRDHPLDPPVKNEYNNKMLHEAYGYYGAAGLLSQKPSMVETNVDSTGILFLAWFMKLCNWSEGTAENEKYMSDECN